MIVPTECYRREKRQDDVAKGSINGSHYRFPELKIA